MSNNNNAQKCTPSEQDIYPLLERLCESLGSPPKNHKSFLRYATQYLTNCPIAFSSILPYDDILLEEKLAQHIKKNKSQTLTKTNTSSTLAAKGLQPIGNNSTPITTSSSSRDVALFTKLYGQLKNSQELKPQTLNALATFLLAMADGSIINTFVNFNGNENGSILGNRFSSRTTMPNLDSYRSVTSIKSQLPVKTDNLSTPRDGPSSSTFNPRSFWSAQMQSIQANHSDNSEATKRIPAGQNQPSNDGQPSVASEQPQIDINEEIINNAVFVLTGSAGKYLKKDVITGKFKLTSKAKSLNAIQGGMLLRLSNLGYYRDLLEFYVKEYNGSDALGLMGDALLHALIAELTKYYAMIAVLKSQYKVDRVVDSSIASLRTNSTVARFQGLTLMKLLTWSVEPLQRLQWLACLADSCREKKGGQLASVLYDYLKNGSPMVQSLTKETLLKVCKPLHEMLITWLLEGEINDVHGEFFIECIPEVGPDRLWNDKYRLRKSMRPNFISQELAKKILVTGKSINFLREICGDNQPVKGGDELKRCIIECPEQIFSYVPDTKFHAAVDAIYLNTSKQVLDMAMGRYRLLDHLQAMRRYLLLGQGDFIGSLMESLKTELDKPAAELYSNDLSAAMDAAVRTSNAKYDDPEIINYLDVRLQTPCSGEVGWDILSLQYTVRGPLSTMLEPSMDVYQILFKPLWRMKHLEFVLSSKIWKDQKCNTKALRPMATELRSTMYRLYLLTSEMIHFINQMQYYILFEVIECSWAVMQEQVQTAKTLDDILNAHSRFLDDIRNGVFLDNEKNILSQYLESVYDSIIRLEVWQDKFYEVCFKELASRKKLELAIKKSENDGKFGVTTIKQLERDHELKIFEQILNGYQKSLDNIGADYEKAISCFLLSLNSNNDHNLQLFGIRLDFNEYYKKRDHNLTVPLTFERMRMSSVFMANVNKSICGGRPSLVLNN